MPHKISIPRDAAANDWLIRQRNPSFADWDAFILWLEADPDHAAIYDELAALDACLPDLPTPQETQKAPMPLPRAANDGGHGPETSGISRRWIGGALAAALVAAIAIPNIAPFLDRDVRRIETAAGQHQSITLPDGSKIDLNGNSVLELVESRPRYARLTTGEAMFHIVHQDDKPFLVETHGAHILDLGTAFNVTRQHGQTSVSVSEGMVVFNPATDNVKMRAGQGVVAADNRTARLHAKPVDIAAVGGWRAGLLVYNGVPLSQVAADLHRTTGLKISVSVDAADIDFRGALSIDPDSQRTIEDLAALSGTRALKQGRGWMLSR